jgi:hypothetical protein
MRRDWLALIIAAFLVGCGDQSPSTMPALQAGEALNARRAVAKNYIAQLSGGEEVPANDSRSRGNAEFQLSPDGSELSYRLIVANLQDLHMAHIHSGTAGANGPIVVWLYPSAPPPEPIPGRTSGVLAEGVITEANLVGPLATGTMDDLLTLMNEGGAYVNVHTAQFGGGEVRGQIKAGG